MVQLDYDEELGTLHGSLLGGRERVVGEWCNWIVVKNW